MVVITLRSDLYYQTLNVTLDSVSFQISTAWNTREGDFFLSIADVDGNPIVSGWRMNVSQPVALRLQDARKPAGALMPYDTSGAYQNAAAGELGARVQLYYFPASDVATVAAGGTLS